MKVLYGNTVIINDKIRGFTLREREVKITYDDNSSMVQLFDDEEIAKNFYSAVQKILVKKDAVFITTGWMDEDND